MVPKPKREKRTFSQIFLDKLRDLSDGESLIGNKTLRDELRWDEGKYTRTKNTLINDGLVISRRGGNGGSIALANEPTTKALNVFVSYSHKDEKFKEELLAHMKPLERMNLVKAWHDGKINAGEKIDEKIYDSMNKSDIVLLLVSVDFINSIYCYENELDKALDRHEKGLAVVVPVILRQCLWKYTSFGNLNLKAVPKDGKAVDSWESHDEAFTDIVTRIHEVANALLGSK